MSNKLTVTKNKMAALGIKKNKQNDYEYINPEDETKSKYKSVKKEVKY
ncbi:MAG: hypothetical protein ACREV6_00935 [Clostridium sp.]